MKRLFLGLFIVLSVLGFSQTDTAQVVVPNRKNTYSSLTKPYVILISADGFRYDYAKKYQAKNILKLAEKGVSAKAMIPSYPSITGPNHYTMITGLFPSHTGFVDNYFYDQKRKDTFGMSVQSKISDGSWLGGIPLWSLAEKQGTLAASLFWVASNSDAGGVRPTYYYQYHEKFSADQKINIVLNWLKLPEDKRPHLITFYFPEVDKNGHLYGTESPELCEAVEFVDDAVGKLIQKVNELQLPNVNFIFVSDHGMIDVDLENPLEIPELLLNKNRFTYFNAQTLLRVMVKNEAEVKQVYRELKKNRTRDYKVYLTDKFPKKLHYRTSDDRFGRIGQILLVPNAPKVFLESGSKKTPGKHGYNPFKVPEMRATFAASGPAFKEGKKIGKFRNVNLYPMVAEILGLKVSQTIDGSPKTAKKVLK
ncbi:ectonucleotide pyrophosphatase/phosphodiesterase [Kaistella sp. BT6-1-3]|uniref:Ectonucleotide pyrophosphatase/phosphodiesterase n=1 Tax=Kaistella yananensis TaxID=2989820 RepID=A0ABT3JQ87_9FLAO|nr:ectonucleotide pyrophosphatase/phosphodiesterase [Kaistella yananensis]MCW4452934.1 ectonucleotide pyrophosphatase/phosphodiesterase [Kaistella yananensis]